jgi:hypothetical protein
MEVLPHRDSILRHVKPVTSKRASVVQIVPFHFSARYRKQEDRLRIEAEAGNPKPSAYLLAAYAVSFAAGTVFLCVVDPGVGGAQPAIILEADARWYVGPGNGLPGLREVDRFRSDIC